MDRTSGIILAAVATVAVVGFGIYMIDLDVTDEGALPDVDVSVEGGELPEIDADVGSITAGTKTEEVTVPDVDIDSQTVEVEVPTIDITPPEDDS